MLQLDDEWGHWYCTGCRYSMLGQALTRLCLDCIRWYPTREGSVDRWEAPNRIAGISHLWYEALELKDT
jgi:hypothetical protein